MSQFVLQNGQIIITYYEFYIYKYICILSTNLNEDYYSIKYVTFGNIDKIKRIPPME